MRDMLPVLVAVGPLTISSYGFLLLLGFIVGLFVIWKRSKEEHFDEEQVFDVVFAASLYGLIGARLVYVLFHFGQFGFDVFSWLNILGNPGLSLFGVFVGAAFGLWRQMTLKRWELSEFSDIVVLGAALFMVFGYLGTFLNGSHIGIPTNLSVGVEFPNLYDRRHPVQLYAAIGYLGLFWLLWWLEGKYRTFEWYRAGKSSARSGFLTFTFVFFTGLIQLLVTILTLEDVRIGGVRPEWFLWGALVFLGVGGLYLRSGRSLSDDIRNLRLPRFGFKKR